MTDTNKIKKLAKLATPGPWYATWEEGDDIAWSNLFPVIRADNGEVVIGNEGFYSDLEQDKANATFCAAANPRAVLDLLDEIDRLRAERDAALARVVELERGKVYVEARQCDECQHVGINDSATVVAACHECDWTGPEPEEDKCPGCQRENCMAAACPQCGARYVLVASEEIAAPVAQAQHSVPEEWHCMLANLQWHYEPYDDHYHRDQGFYCPVCGGEKDEGHKQGCNLAKLIATADLKEDKK